MSKVDAALRRVLIALLFLISNAEAKVQLTETSEYSVIFEAIKQMGSAQPADSILLVFDIDKTLLNTENCIPNFQPTGLLNWMRMISECPSTLTEPMVKPELESLQAAGFATIALTARPPSLIEVSERELTGNGLKFLGHPFTSLDNVEATWGRSLRVNFRDGVMYASGGDKGLILKEFIARKSPTRRKIVFVDDDSRNTQAVKRAFENDESTDVRIFHYTRYSE